MTVTAACLLAVASAKAQTVVIFGSSTALGLGASSYQSSWPGLLTAVLSAKGYEVVNRSVAGTNTADSLARFDRDVAPWQPRFVILGTSIMNEPGSAAAIAQRYVQNTQALIAKVEAIGAIPILAGPYPNDGLDPALYAAVGAIYAEFNTQAPVLDFFDTAADAVGHWVKGVQYDATHPNSIGHGLLFDAIPVTLFDALLRPPPPTNPQGFGSWKNAAPAGEGARVDVAPSSAMGSWTASFWSKASEAVSPRVLLAVNRDWLQVQRSGAELKLFARGAKVGAAILPSGNAFHAFAVTYQKITGAVMLYVDGRPQIQVTIADGPVSDMFSFGGVAGAPELAATGDSFADVVLYRAPLRAQDVQQIHDGRAPWKSVEAWLPLTGSPSRPWVNLAASTAAASVIGAWEWCRDDVRDRLRPPVLPSRAR